MIDIKELLKSSDQMKANVVQRVVKADVEMVLAMHRQYIGRQQEIERLQHQANQASKAGGAMSEADKEAAKALRKSISDLRAEQAAFKPQYEEALEGLPNWTSPDVPVGDDDNANMEIARFGEPTRFDFKPKDHVELGATLDLIDFEAGAKVAGTKFYFLKNEAVLLQHAIKSYAFRKAIQQGFTPLLTPDLARDEVLKGAGYAPRGESSNTYQVQDTGMSLVATAEIAVGGMHADEILDAARLPLLYVAESHCFRREAGTAGRASKGLYRVHQFEKIELFAFTTPAQSPEIHDRLLALEESIYQDLGLAYRVVVNCTGDLGAAAYKKYDIEAWMPGKGDNGEYGEVTSASNCTDYQARRLNIRYKDPVTGRNEFVHTLNGTAVALSRAPVAIMENYQQSDGSIRIPEVLVPYLGFGVIKPGPKSAASFSA